MIATVDSFIRIFKFYQQNTLASIEEKFKANTLRYEDTVDVYLNSLVLDKATQLSYNSDSSTIQIALDARKKMSTYFKHVLYPGSYAFNTRDNASFRKMILDWTSTIKTIQNSSKQLTDVYSLSSEDIDKALRGFGASFINHSSLPSLEKRKSFLLNLCDLYSIKGSSDSIIRALKIVGLTNIYIREGWLFKTDNNDLKFQWKIQKSKNSFNNETLSYEDADTLDDLIFDWNWFEEKIAEGSTHYDDHWMYTKDEILEIESNTSNYIKLPSITPYFGIEFVTDSDTQTDTTETITHELDQQFKRYLQNQDKLSDKCIDINNFDDRLSLLECYIGLVYSLIRFDDHFLYENFKSYLEKSEYRDIPDATTKYSYFELVYWFYRVKIAEKLISGDLSKINEAEVAKAVLKNYIPLKSVDYCNYQQLMRWWLTSDYIESEKKTLDILYIKPIKTNDYAGYVELQWDSPFDIGKCDIECYSSSRVSDTSDGWMVIEKGINCTQSTMKKIVSIEDVDEYGANVNYFRIVYYHTSSNIPSVFFEAPFYFDYKNSDSYLDRIIRYNGITLGLSLYNDEEIKNAFKKQNIQITTSNYDIISNYRYLQNSIFKTRVTNLGTDVSTFYSSAYNYPSITKLYEDKWMNINNDFFNYVDWSIKDFTDTQKHVGIFPNPRNIWISDDKSRTFTKKWPVNYKWNWAIDNRYYYICYEANKWCRIKIDKFVDIEPSTLVGSTNNSITYGDKVFVDNTLYVYVANNKFAKILDSEYNWGVLDCNVLPNGKIKVDSFLFRDIAVAKIEDKNILSYIRIDCNYNESTNIREEAAKVLKTIRIEVLKDPYSNTNSISSYTYKDFLKYLYATRLTIDLDTGYIYPVSYHYKDNDRICFKCKTTGGDGNEKWVRIVPEYDWDLTLTENSDGTYTAVDGEETYTLSTIYSDWEYTRTVDSKGNVTITKTSNGVNLGYLFPLCTFPNRYDSLRFLDGPVFDSYDELIAASDNDQIDHSINLVFVKPKGTYADSYPYIYKRVDTVNASSNRVEYNWELCTENRIYDVNLGINSKLIEYIESKYAQDSQYYIDIISDFNEGINNYIINKLELDNSVTDITIANMLSNNIINNIINFFKPKRARILFVDNTIECNSGTNNYLDNLDFRNSDYNYYDLASYKYDVLDKRRFSKLNRVRVREVINDYLPLHDMIYKSLDSDYQVYSSRELYTGNSKIPSIELYDNIIDFNTQAFDGIAASFYVEGFSLHVNMNGFYYKKPDTELYTNNRYYFEKVPFLYHNSYGRIVSEKRWALFDCNNDVATYETALYVANVSSNKPYSDTTTEVIYAINRTDNDDITTKEKEPYIYHPKYIDGLVYNEGKFQFNKRVKINSRTIKPSLYFDSFDIGECNGFYYQDSILYPDRNGKPVYFNQNGKILTYVDISDYYKINDNYDLHDYETGRFWLILSNKQYSNFNDCDYFAFCWDGDETINVINDNRFTKDFHKEINTYTDRVFRGYTIDYVTEHEEIIVDKFAARKPKYDIYKNQRFNHFNTIKESEQPIACIETRNKVTRNIIPGNSITIGGEDVSFKPNKEANTYGAIAISNELGEIEFNIDHLINDTWSIACSIYPEDDEAVKKLFGDETDIIPNKWYMTVLTSELNFDYYLPLCRKFHYDNSLKYLNPIRIKMTKRDEELLEYKKQRNTEINKLNKKDVYYNEKLAEINARYDKLVLEKKTEYVELISDEVNLITAPIYEYANDIDSNTLVKTYVEYITNLFDGVNPYTDTCKIYMNNLIFALETFRDKPNDITTLNATILETVVEKAKVSNKLASEFSYNKFYVNGKLDPITDHTYIDEYKNLQFNGCNVRIDEFGVWDNVLSDWYINVITKFRILRHRPEPQQSKTSKSKKNFRPLFVREGRSVFYREQLGVPENTKGGRINSYNADPTNRGDKFLSEMNPLWRKDLSETENHNLIVKNGTDTELIRHYINDGETLNSSSDYLTDDRIPFWWIRSKEEYRTGPIHHNPVYISIKEKIVETYPDIKRKGIEHEPTDYYDQYLNFDGINNENTSYYDGTKTITTTNIDQTYQESTYDVVTKYSSTFDRYYDGEYKEKDIKLENYGGTYISELSDKNIALPDVAQQHLTKDQMSNGIFHDNLKYFTNDTDYSYLNGIWTIKDHVDSYQDGDFNMCYQLNNLEAVLTYQRASGYFWWEIRRNTVDGWITVARTFVNNRRNHSRKLNWMEYYNWNQIDLASQRLCKFDENVYEDFATKPWEDVNQELLDGYRFTCGIWIKLEIEDIKNDKFYSPESVFFNGKNLYFYDDKVNLKWYKIKNKCNIDWEGKEDFFDDTKRTPSNFLYRNGYLYYHTGKEWIRIQVTNIISDNAEWSKHYQLWKFEKSTDKYFVYMNVIDSSDCETFEDSYYNPDNIIFMETYIKLVRFNGVSSYDWVTNEGNEFIEARSVNNEYSPNRCYIKDHVVAYQFDKFVFEASGHLKWTYDGSYRSLVTFMKTELKDKITLSGGSGAYKVEYSDSKDGPWESNNTFCRNAGSYCMYLLGIDLRLKTSNVQHIECTIEPRSILDIHMYGDKIGTKDGKDIYATDGIRILNNNQIFDGNKKIPQIEITDVLVPAEKTKAENIITIDDYEISYPDMINPGEYTITITGKNNYKDSREIEYVVKEAEKLLDPPVYSDYVYNGVKPNMTELTPDYKPVTVKVSWSGDEHVGDYNVTLEITDNSGYKWSNTKSTTCTSTFRIIQATNEWTKLPTVGNWQVGEESKITLGESKFGTPYVRYSGTTFTGKTVSDITDIKELEPGNYVAIFKVDTNSYNDYTSISYGGTDIENTQFTYGYSDFVFTIKQTLVSKYTDEYDGTSKSFTYYKNKYKDTVTLTGGSGNYTTEYSQYKTGPWSSSDFVYTNAGNYVTYVKVTDNVSKNSIIQAATISITARNISKAIHSISNNNHIYDSTVVKPNITITDVVNKKSIISSNDYTISYPVMMNIGTYTIKITGRYNYTGTINKPFVIQNATDIVVPSIESKTYTGRHQFADISENDYYRVIENNGGTDVGSYNVILELKKSGYKWNNGTSMLRVTIPFEITKAENRWVSEPYIRNWTYGDKGFFLGGSLKFGTPTVEFYNTNGIKLNSQPVDAGDYTMICYGTETNNWNMSSKISKPFTIYQKALTITSSNGTWTYDENSYSSESITVSGLVEGD